MLFVYNTVNFHEMSTLNTPWFARDRDIKNNAWVTVNNDFYGHEWGDLPTIFVSDEVTSENHWQITSRVTKNRYSR